LHKQGHIVWVLLSVSLLCDAEGEPLYFISQIEDITARRDAEEQIQQLNQDLERRVDERTAELRTANELLRLSMEETQRAAQAKSEFLSRASHELRTPLNVILGFAQLLEFEELPETSRECVNHILSGGQHLLQLVNEVLDIARIESGHLRTHIEAVNLAEAMREMSQLTRALATRRDVSLSVADGEDPAWAMADHQLLKQVMLNLLSNAVKYNRREGNVIVSWERSAPGWWRCVVEDTGHGIRQEDRPRLFQPFERLDSSLSGTEGAGLGLMICQHFMSAMQGRIGVESEVGVGSRFWIELPETMADSRLS
jgi:signal transduction histidine kinase